MARTPIALVTGANRGIGREVARQLAKDHGLFVLVGARNMAQGKTVAQEIGQQAAAIELDVSSDASVARAFQRIETEYGHLDCLVNNAGVDYDTDQRAYSADLNRVRTGFATNLFGAWAMVLAAVPLLRKSPHPRVVNVSSGSGSMHDMSGGTPGYGVAKAALNALTLKLADELLRDRFLVNAVCPGWVATDMGGGGRPIPEGARGVVWAATLPDDGPTGGFFRDGRRLEL